jgi:predicted phage terminase large subunit-like protein
VIDDLTPAEWVRICCHGRYELPHHIRCLDAVLHEAIQQEGARILIETPPRHGKSFLVGAGLPSYYLGKFPEREVIVASATHNLAKRNVSRARGWMAEFGPQVFDVGVAKDTRAKDEWNTTLGGTCKAFGVGSQVHGRGGDLMVFDDLVSGTEALRSEVQLDNVWEFVRDDLWSRTYPWTTIVSILTRWSEDDPHGRMLTEMEHEGWIRIRMPALAEDDDVLGREPGEALWPERFPAEWLEQIKKGRSSYAWSALYQQRPTPEEGGIFKRDWFTTRYRTTDEGYAIDGQRDIIPRSKVMPVMLVDLAFTEKKSSDYTAIAVGGLVMGSKPQQCLLLDVRRERLNAPKIVDLIVQTMHDWNVRQVYVERAGQQIGFIDLLRQQGIPVKTLGRARTDDLIVSGDKEAVWHDSTPFARNSRLIIPQHAGWLDTWLHEMLLAPNGANDDQVDVTAWLMLLCAAMDRRGWAPTVPPDMPPRANVFPGMQPGKHRKSIRDIMS